MASPRFILHIGAPKCGSSALQSALTATPDILDRDGRLLRYLGVQGGIGGLRPVAGAKVQRLGMASPYGYLSWPNVVSEAMQTAVAEALKIALRNADRDGTVSILSSESWISSPDFFARTLAALGHPPVEAVVFLRPPVDWVNAAWWQWAVWSARDLESCLRQGGLAYRFAQDLEAWAAIPNLSLSVNNARPDAVGRFAEIFGLVPPSVRSPNSALSPSLVGFLLRNRQFRPHGHDARTEFAIQRWCPPIPGPRLWAIKARHVHMLRPVVRQTIAALDRLLPEAERDALFTDPRWLREAPYHDAINAGTSVLDDPADLPVLYDALNVGVRAAAKALGAQLPTMPEMPGPDAGIKAWDLVISGVLETLLTFDSRVRANHSSIAESWLRHAFSPLRRQ